MPQQRHNVWVPQPPQQRRFALKGCSRKIARIVGRRHTWRRTFVAVVRIFCINVFQLEHLYSNLAAGVRACPTDHELRQGLATVLTSLGEVAAAKEQLHAAHRLYPSCPRACNALGDLLLEEGRPRAALRQFERALARSVECDMDDGWHGSMHVALCMLTLADAYPNSTWPQFRLPEARAYLRRCLGRGASAEEEEWIGELLAAADAFEEGRA